MSSIKNFIEDVEEAFATIGADSQEIYNALIAAQERERIIKILETKWLPIADVDACIALIKGMK